MKELILTRSMMDQMEKTGAKALKIHAWRGDAGMIRGTVEPQCDFIDDEELIRKLEGSTYSQMEYEGFKVFMDPELEYWKRTVTVDWKRGWIFHKAHIDGIYVRSFFTSNEVRRRTF